MGDREENVTGDVASLMNELERLAVEVNAAVAFGAHFSKGNQAGKESIDRISGSGVFARDPDTILPLTRHKEENAFVIEPTLRNFPPVSAFCVRWEYPLMRIAEDLDPAELKQPGGGSKNITPTEDSLLFFFEEADSKKRPRDRVLNAGELEKKFTEANYDKSDLTGLRDQLERQQKIRVLRNLPHNQVIAGLPEAVDAFTRWNEKQKSRARKKIILPGVSVS